MNKIICLALYKGIFILFHREKKLALQKSTTEKPISRLSVELCPFKKLWLPVWEDLWVLWPSCTQGACVTNRATSCLGSKGYSGHYSIAIGPCLDLSLALWLHHPGERKKERKRKTVCTHPSMSISNYSSTNHWWGSIGSGWAGLWWREGLDRGMKRRRECPKMPGERQRNNCSIQEDGFCHFEEGCQRVVHSHLLGAISSNSGCGWHISPSRCSGPIPPRLSLVPSHTVSINHSFRDNDTRNEHLLFSLAINLHRSMVHLQRAISNNDLSPHSCNCKASLIILFHPTPPPHSKSHCVLSLTPALLHTWGEAYTLPVPVLREQCVHAEWLTQ